MGSTLHRQPAFCTFLLVVLLLGCTPQELSDSTSAHEEWLLPMPKSHEAYNSWLESNPCGHLHVVKPVFNVSGRTTTPPRLNSTLYLLIAPNASLERALWTVRNCAPIGRMPLNESGQFVLEGLPASSYFAVVRRSHFSGGQGFPSVSESEGSDHSVCMLWQGGDVEYSIAAFTVASGGPCRGVRGPS